MMARVMKDCIVIVLERIDLVHLTYITHSTDFVIILCLVNYQSVFLYTYEI